MSLSKKEFNRPSAHALRKLNGSPWGFTIYRTVYTPKSNDLFPLALAKLSAYIQAEIRDEVYFNRKLSPGPCEELMSLFQNTVVEDKERFNGASISDVRDCFKRRLEEGESLMGVGMERKVCLMIDEQIMKGLASAPEPVEDFLKRGGCDVWVKVVDGLWNEQEGYGSASKVDKEYEGWLLGSASQLFRMWNLLDVLPNLWCTWYVGAEFDQKRYGSWCVDRWECLRREGKWERRKRRNMKGLICECGVEDLDGV